MKIVKKFSNLRLSAAPLAVGIALIAAPAFAQDSAAADDQTEATADEPTLVVTGTRITNANLTAVSPVTSIGNADIKQSGTQRTEDLLNSLPQVFASQTSTLSNGATGTATVDLRGLGSQRTLVLINGRRLMPGDVTSSAADLNFVPSSIVKRVDVLTGGASATYGADAVAGVVNFVMDTEMEGLRIDANYGVYQHNNRNATVRPILDRRAAAGLAGYGYPKGSVVDGGQFDATVSFGTKFDEGRGHAMAYFGYRKADPVLQARRDYSACTIQNTGASLGTGTTFPLPVDPVRLNPAAPLQCGGSLTSATGTAIYFTTSSSSSTVAALGAGTLGIAPLNRYNFAPLNYFQRPDERYTAGAFIDYEISPALNPYMEFMFMDDRTLAQIAPSGDFGNTLTINCDNPLLSAQQASLLCANGNLINNFIGTFPVATNANYNPNSASPAINFVDPFDGHTYNKGFFQLLRRNVEGGPRINDLQHTAYRAVLGLKGDLGDAWSYDAYYQYGRMNYSQVYRNEFSVARLTNALDVVADPRPGANFGNPVCRVTATGQDPLCAPYDVFSGAAPSAAALNYLSATGFQKGQVSEQVVSAIFNGDLGAYGIKSPAATDGVSIAIGGEYRREALELQVDNAFATGDLSGQGAPTLPITGNYTVTEFISEAEIPLVQDNGIYNLSVNAGYRYSHYKISNGNTFNTDTYKIGVDFAPVRDIRFRAAYNRAVRAPNIQELFSTQFVGLDGSTDPCAGAPITATQYGCLAQGLVVGQNVVANPAAQYNGLLGGNTNLQPEIATTKTIGVVLQPRVIPGLSFSVDWYDIKIVNAIQGYGADAILNACGASPTLAAANASLACGLINRNAAGSLWLTSDGYVSDLPQNVGGTRTRGLEFNGNYSHEVGGLGSINLNFVGTRLEKYEVDNGLTPLYNCAGYYGTTCGGPAPEWRHKLRMTFNTKMGISLSGQWRHFGPVDIDYKNPSSSLSSNYYNFGSTLPSQDYFDLSMTANVGRNFSWRLGVNNLLDKEPPLVTSGSGRFGASAGASNGNTFPGTYDALGRYIYTGVTLDF
ncbi:TonB-dependent receptor domain-containing protein [Novosphingobium sp.]|uniref:TonB-dependent receptor domain-containing protein n=1 Tax=Novosphingobium sp. TaxID=1874826 RepID=UPI00286AA7A1|nr:TonB-dependent receptor [Novosphingobium sp.]